MDPRTIMTAISFLKSDTGKSFLKILQSSDQDRAKKTAKTLLKGFGSKNIDDLSATEMIELAQSFDVLEQQSADEIANKIRKLMVGTPGDYITRGLGSAFDNTVGYLGKRFGENDPNFLAKAILAANRQNNTARENIYGPSPTEKASEMWANEKLRRGANVKALTDSAQNVFDDTFGEYKRRDDQSRAMQAAAYLNGPGSLYNYLNGMESRSSKIRGGKR